MFSFIFLSPKKHLAQLETTGGSSEHDLNLEDIYKEVLIKGAFFKSSIKRRNFGLKHCDG